MWIKTWNFWTFLPWREVDERKTLKDIFKFGIEWIVKGVQKKYRKSIASILQQDLEFLQDNPNSISISEIGIHIEETLEKINASLDSRSKSKNDFTRIKNLLELKYKVFLYWLLEVFKKKWFDIHDEDTKVHNVPDKIWESIYNILRDRGLTTFFMMSKAFWLLEFSDNIINSFPEEKEIKVLETSYSEVQSGLEKWKWVKVTEKPMSVVEDVYYDDIDLRLDRQDLFWTKRSFRIRKKTYENWTIEYFYTIKRKKPEKKWKQEEGTVDDMEAKKLDARECYEYEFKILKPEIFEWFLQEIWLRESRSKIKRRRKFEISFRYRWKQTHAVLDIDDYENGIPEFLEIECDNDKATPFIIKKLWLKDKTLLTCWSRWVFKYYKDKWMLAEEYKNKYNVDEESGIVSWDDGSMWNSKKHKVIKKPKNKQRKK